MSVHTEQRPDRGRNKSYRCTLAMTDQDVVERFAAVVGCGRVFVRSKREHWKTLYVWECASADAMDVITLLKPYFGERRAAKAHELLDGLWERYKPRICKRCGTAFEPTRRRGGRPQVYCSAACASQRSTLNNRLRDPEVGTRKRGRPPGRKWSPEERRARLGGQSTPARDAARRSVP